MQRIPAIFRKDARHLWPQIVTLTALLAIAAALDPTYTGGSAAVYDFLPAFALPFACWLVVISAVHQERIPGDRQYWLTRPYSWKELLAAKALFVAAFVNLPLLLYHAGVCIAVGIPLSDHLAALLWRQVFFTVFYILPAFAIAAITTSLGQVFVTALAGTGFVWVSGTTFMLLAKYRLIVFQGLNGSMTAPVAVIIATGGTAILLLQYSRRRTVAARILTSIVTAAVLCATFLGPQLFGHTSTATAAASLALDVDAGRTSSMFQSGRPGIATLDIPVRLEGIPNGTAIQQQRMTVFIQAPGQQSPPGSGDGGLHDFAGGRAWLSVFIDRKFVDAAQSGPVTLFGSVSFERFDRTKTYPVTKGRAAVIPGVGVCRDAVEPDGLISLFCYSPGPRTALMIGNSGVRMNWIVPQGSVQRSVPTSSEFQPLMKFVSQVAYRSWDQIGDARYLAMQPLPPVRIVFQFTGIRLADYLVPARTR